MRRCEQGLKPSEPRRRGKVRDKCVDDIGGTLHATPVAVTVARIVVVVHG